MLSDSTQRLGLLALAAPELCMEMLFSKAGNSFCMQTITPQ